jgi:hypothetical protein
MNNNCSKCGDAPQNMVQNKASSSTTSSVSECMFKMQDGRSFTDYRPRCTIQYQMKNDKNMSNSYESRMFLINNAEKMMKANAEIVHEKNNCCNTTPKIDTVLPERNMVECNKSTCNYLKDVNSSGLGTGRIYN